MMADYISREAAIEAVKHAWAKGLKPSQYIEILPAADVAEVVYGQWEGEGDGYADGEIVLDVWHCSQCGYCIDDGTDNPDCLPNYCPNCGAKMDGGDGSVAD